MNTPAVQWCGRLLRLLPVSMPGKARPARRMLRGIGSPAEILVETRTGERLLVPNLDEPIGFHLFIDGVYEPESFRLLHQYLQPGATFVDVGANIGTFAVRAARQVGA